MTRFLHLTDLHLSMDTGTAPKPDTRGTLDRVLTIAREMQPRPDFIVASGDLTDTGDAASYAHLAGVLAGVDIPVVLTLGNHDRRAEFHAAFPGYAGAPQGPADNDTVLAGLHVIALDSSVAGRVSGDLDYAQFAALEERLARHRDLPKLLTVHHPPRTVPQSTHHWAWLSDVASARLAEMLEGRNVVAILSGHVHMNRVALWHGIPVVTTIGQHSTIDMTRQSGITVVEGAAFAICDLLATGLHVTFVPLGEARVLREIPAERLRGFS